MPDERYRELTSLVHNRAGEAFRAAVGYDGDDWAVLYVRDDVATDELRDALPGLVDRAAADEPLVERATYGGLGEVQATVELHDRAAVLHFREGESAGVIVSLDRDVAQGLGAFVNQCDEVLAGR